MFQSYTVKPTYTGQAIQRTPCNSGHFFVDPSKSRSNLYRKTPVQWTIIIADTIFRQHVKSSSQIYVSKPDSAYFFVGN